MITVSIVTYKTRLAELDKVIGCLRRSPVERVFVVDNGSQEAIRQWASAHDFVEYIPSPNVGYGSGHNKGIRRALEMGADYHIVMNSDIYWSDPVIEKSLEYLEAHPDVGQLMPKMYYPDGRLQYQCKLVPKPSDLLRKRFLPSSFNKKHLNRFQLEFTGYDHVMNVPYLSGSFMMFRVSALRDVGLFDERFFMYPEDVDMTRRMHERYKTVFFPEVSLTHVYNVSSRKSLRLFLVHMYNMVKYFNKWGWITDDKRSSFNERLLKSEDYVE